jgi:Mrp family chromosome partitioning ATPase
MSLQNEIEVDARGRTTLKKAGAEEGRYRVTRFEDGSLRLDPLVTHTRAEILALSSPTVLKKHEDARAGRTEFVESPELP